MISTQIRPTGVTIIAILEIISGIVAIAFGVFVGIMGSMGSMFGIGEIIEALGWVVVAIGIVSFILAYGLLKGKSWGSLHIKRRKSWTVI